MPLSDYQSLTEFDDYIGSLSELGAISNVSLDDEHTYKAFQREFAKTFDDPAIGRIKQAELESLSNDGINTISKLQAFKAQEQANQERAEQDNAFEYSVDQAQKLFGQAIATLGDAGDTSFAQWASDVGNNIVSQQEADIKAGGYKSVHKGGFLDQEGIGNSAGWILEKMIENSVTSGLTLLGAGAAAITAPISATAALGIGGATIGSSLLMGVGEVASELKEKDVYDPDNVESAIAVGLISGALDAFSAGKIIPKGAIISRLLKDGTANQVKNEIGLGGLAKSIGQGFAIEGMTEVAQEGASILHAMSQGAEYDDDELVNRFVDSIVVGGAMGGTTRAAMTAPAVVRGKLGELSSRYESNGDPSAIGHDRTGGHSYGTYQIASKQGQMDAFINFLSQASPDYANELNQAGGESASRQGDETFKSKWRELSQDADFADLQHSFIKASHYDPLVNKIAEEQGFDATTRSKALNDVIWSTAVQHGGNTNVFSKATSGMDLNNTSDVDIIDAIYAERSKRFPSSTEQVRESVLNRFENERRDAVAAAEREYSVVQSAVDNGEVRLSESQMIQPEIVVQPRITYPNLIYDVANNKHEIAYEVIEADDAIAAIDKADNQYRDRNRASYTEQVDRIANQLEYPLVSGQSVNFSSGAPVISNEDNIIAGNGRMLGIQKAYDDGNAENYRNDLINDAGSFGIDPDAIAGMNKPVLIRRLVNDVDTNELAILSNEREGADISDLEQAQIDAERIGTLHDFNPASDLDNFEIDFDSSIGIAQRLSSKLATGKENAILDESGKNISKEGRRRIKNAILYMAYGDSPVLSSIVESDTTDNANIYKGLMGAAAHIAEMKDGIRQGLIYDADITPEIIRAVDLFTNAKNTGESIDSLLNQTDLFASGNYSDEVRAIIQKLDSTTRSPNKLRGFLVDYTEKLKSYGNPNQVDAISDRTPTKLQVLANAEQGSEFRLDEFNDGTTTTESTDGSVTGEPGSPGNDSGIAGTTRDERPVTDNQDPLGVRNTGEPTELTSNVSSSVMPVFGNEPTVEVTDEPADAALPINEAVTLNDGGNNIPPPDDPFTISEPYDDGVDWDAEANVDQDSWFNRAKNKIGETYKLWLTDTVSKYGVDAQNLSERTQAKTNGEYAKWVTGKQANMLKEIESTVYNGTVPQQDLDLLRDYVSVNDDVIKQAIPLPNEMKELGDNIRRDIDTRTDQIISLVAVDASRTLNTTFTVDDVLLADIESKEVVDPETNTTSTIHTMTAKTTGESITLPDSLVSSIRLAQHIDSNKGEYLTRTYAIHEIPSWANDILNSDKSEFKERRKAALQYFGQKIKQKDPQATPEDIGKEAWRQLTNFVRDGSSANDEGILRTRNNEINGSQALRDALGEYKDPMHVYTRTIDRMEQIIAMKEFGLEMEVIAADQGLTIASDPDPEGKLVKIKVRKGKVVENPFHGKWTTPELADFIERTSMDVDDIFPVAQKLNSLWQAAHTVYSVPTVAANIMSVLPVMLATASLRKSSVLDTMTGMGEVFANKKSQRTEAWQQQYGFDANTLFDYMAENQITSGGATGGEALRYLKDAGDSVVGRAFDAAFTNQYEGTGIQGDAKKQALTKVGTAGIKTKEGFEKLYNFGDSLPKMMIFMNEVKRLNGYHAKYGDSVITKEGILEAASNMAKQQAPQYSRIPKLVDFVRKFPTHGQFVAFKAQMYQTLWNQARVNFALMRPDENKAFIKEHLKVDIDGARSDQERAQLISELSSRGLTKTGSMATTVFGFSAAVGMGVSAAFGEDKLPEEELNAANALMPDYYQLNHKTYVGRDEDGVAEFINTGRLNMYGDLNASASIPLEYMNGNIPDPIDATKQFVHSLYAPFVDTTFFTKVVQMSTNKDSFDRAIVTDEDGFLDNALNIASYFHRELINNGTVKMLSEISNDLFAEEEVNQHTGFRYSAENAALSAAGLSTIKFDANKQLTFWMIRHRSEQSQLRARLNGRFKSFSSLDDDKISSDVVNARKEHNDIYDKLRVKIEAARTLGLSEAEIKEAVNISRIGKKNYRYLANGMNPPFMLDKLGSRSEEITNFRNLSDTAKRNFANNYENARRILNSLPAQ